MLIHLDGGREEVEPHELWAAITKDHVIHFIDNHYVPSSQIKAARSRRKAATGVSSKCGMSQLVLLKQACQRKPRCRLGQALLECWHPYSANGPTPE